MINLRRSVIFLIIVLTVFFNIERPNLGEASLINIQTFVYGLAVLAVVVTLVVPWFWRAGFATTLSLWLVVYTALKFTPLPLLEPWNNWSDQHIYVAFTEVALLSFTIWRAREVARHLSDFEEAVSNITFADVSRRVKKLEDAEEDIQIELIRSRRHHHPLTVMVIEPQPDSIQAALSRTIQEVQRTMMSRYVITSLARVISSQLRRTDMVLDQRDKNRFVVVSPDTTAANSTMLADRIQAAAAVQLGVLVSCGVAAFPDQALTFEELVAQAKSDMRSPGEINQAIGTYPTNEVQ